MSISLLLLRPLWARSTVAKRWRWLLIPGLLASLEVGPVPLRAQTPAVRFEHLSVEAGLSHSAVLDIEQDRFGFLWLGARNGLNRYDGYRFRVFQHDPEDPTSLSAGIVFALVEDRQGELWIGTRNGLNRFHRAEERFIRYPHDPEDPRSLSSDYVLAIFEDHTGSLWVGTAEGLNRRGPDGTFVRYLHDPADERSLSDSRILALAEDREGRLWVGSNGGLDLFDRRSATFRHFRHDPADPRSLSDNRVRAIREDASGDLWVGTVRGLNRLDGAASGRETETFTRYRHGPVDLATEGILELVLDREGELWVGTLNAGLIRIPRGAGPPIQYRHDAADSWSLSGDRVLSIFEDQSGILWAGTYVGLNKYHRRREQFAIYRREPGRAQSLTDSNISAILEDRSGVLWVGTWDKGLNRLDRERGTVVHYQPDGVVPPEGDKWGNPPEGDKWGNPPEGDKWGESRSLPDDTVQALCEDRSGALWVATWGGLARLDPARGTFTVYRHDPEDPSSLDSDAVVSVYQDRRGQIWAGTTRGLSRFEPTSESFVRYRLGGALDPGVKAILEDHAGTLWLGSRSEGLFHLAAGAAASSPRRGANATESPRRGANATESPRRGANATESRDLVNLRHDPDDDDSLSGNAINTLHEDRSGNLWIGTDGTGLDRLDRLPERPARQRFSHYREQDGLASNQVLGILEDDAGHLWLSTSRGLSRLDPRTGTFRNFGIEDGLQSNVFSYRSAFESPRGEMFFGGIHGFNAFFPDQIRTDPFVPPVALTDFRLFNESLPPRRLDPESPLEHSILETSEIRLSHRHNVFSLEFAALHYASPQRNRYAYRLEGFDSGWTMTDGSRRLATYTNLDAGSYRFRVRGGNPDGVWNEEEATVRIVVAPPPWKSRWAYGLYTLAVSAVILGAVRSQKRKLERERAISRRLRQVDQLKDEFLANTSHELRTPLNGITGLAESLIDGAAGEVPEAVKSNLSMIVHSGRRLSHLVGDILDFSKLRHKSLELDLRPVDLRPLVEVVLTLSRPLVGSKELELESSVTVDLPAVAADENRLQQILHNLVGNAVKFTVSGSVAVSAAVEGKRIVVTVADTGIGIPADEQERIFDAFEQADASIEREYGGAGLGLAVTRQLVELHGGEIRVESNPGEGSVFSFALPIAEAAPETDGPKVAASRPPALVAPVPVAAEAPAARPAATTEAPAGAARILVVDDDPSSGRRSRRNDRGHRVRQGGSIVRGSIGDLDLPTARLDEPTRHALPIAGEYQAIPGGWHLDSTLIADRSPGSPSAHRIRRATGRSDRRSSAGIAFPLSSGER